MTKNRPHATGKFITFEGPEGVGKSTQIVRVEQALSKRGMRCVVTREPGGTATGEAIRNILLTPSDDPMDARTELLLMFAARQEHLAKLVLPALADGQTVLCDRFTDATYAYQGGGRAQSTDDIAALENWVQGSFRPDLVLLLDAEPDITRDRLRARGDLDRFEREGEAFFERVREAYLMRASANPINYAVIDASLPLEQVTRLAIDSIASMFGESVRGS